MVQNRPGAALVVVLTAAMLLVPALSFSADTGERAAAGSMPWWGWVAILFVLTLALGVVAVVAGVGGAVLFVPIVSSFFPFHLDFVRGTGLLMALAGALSAGPGLLKRGLADLRVALPLAVIGSASSIAGAMVGLALPANVVQTALGGAIVLIVLIIALSRRSDYPEIQRSDALATALRLGGLYYEESTGEEVEWRVHNTPVVLALFTVIGFMAGLFGLGAGWANVPALNLVLGAPLKVAVATSSFVLSLNDTAAAWVYLNQGAVLPLITVPSVAGIMIGTRIGVRVLSRAKSRVVKIVVVTILFVAGVRSLLGGLGVL
jgi:uncharacterized membrane protein YfcA